MKIASFIAATIAAFMATSCHSESQIRAGCERLAVEAALAGYDAAKEGKSRESVELAVRQAMAEAFAAH